MTKRGCIIVPYRDRSEHLSQFLKHYDGILPIYIIEQSQGKPFNRAKLLNIGFLEFGSKYDYAIYHDVDMMAEHFEAYELYPDKPVHLATACSQFNYTMPYPQYFGGVTSISTKDMIAVNGFSNEFWFWGIEDDEMFNMCVKTFGCIHSIQNNIYKCFDHHRVKNEEYHARGMEILKNGRNKGDGLSSCVYDVIERNGNHIIVEL